MPSCWTSGAGRKVIGWATASHLRAELVPDALEMTIGERAIGERAIGRRRPRDVIHHSDQGLQYTSLAFGKRCIVAFSAVPFVTPLQYTSLAFGKTVCPPMRRVARPTLRG